MSDPEVPQNDQPSDIDDVVGSANEGLDAAAAARADVRSEPAEAEGDAQDASAQPESADGAPAEAAASAEPAAPHADPDMEAFAAAERDFPGTFAASAGSDAAGDEKADDDDATRVLSTASDSSPETRATDTPTVADEAYAPPAFTAAALAAETQVVPAEPVVPPAAPQPIFVQAPEPPRDLGNRGAAGAIGLVATIAFAILYLGATVGLGALAGDVTGDNIADAFLAPLTTFAFWTPVVVFFLAFWLLGAFVNRARWGKWVILGLLVGIAAWGGNILGELLQAPFWQITATESTDVVNKALLAPLGIAAFVFARELSIWFGAWVSHSGAKKKALNAEAQAEYERTLEAGPSALR